MAHPLSITSSRFDRRSLLRGAIAVAALSASPWRTGHAAVSSKGEKVELNDAAIADLQKSIKGTVILPTSSAYDQARRVWSPLYNRRPALIAKCASVADVQATVQFARRHDLLTAVRCGGHSLAGFSAVDEGLLIDLSQINQVTIDTTRKTARVGGGSLLGDLDRATAPHKLATTAGVVSHTGVGGLATGGGQGRLARKFGLTVDNNRGVEMVLADGTLVRANATENPDLYWAVRGGGGNFGIVTQFEFQLHEYDGVVTSLSYRYPAAKAKDAFRAYLDITETASPELSVSCGLRTSANGETTVQVSASYLGPKAAGEAAMARLSALGETAGAPRIDEMAYTRLQSIADGNLYSDVHSYGKSALFRRLDEKVIDALVDYYTRNSVPLLDARFSHQGGAIAKVAETATAYPGRDGIHQGGVDFDWREGQDSAAGKKHVQALWGMIEPSSTHSSYINNLYDYSEEALRTSFGGNYARLVDVKTKVDPTNFFRLNTNIRPRNQV